MTEDSKLEENYNTFSSIFREIPDEQIIKSMKIYITGIFPRDYNLTILEISEKILKRYFFLLKELKILNSERKETINLYSFNKPSIIPIPLGILYSDDNNQDETEENLLNQGEYFHKLFNLAEDKPVIKIIQLENKFIEKFRNQLAIESNNKQKKDFKLAKNIHSNKIELYKGKLINGDYYYYHTGLGKSFEKV